VLAALGEKGTPGRAGISGAATSDVDHLQQRHTRQLEDDCARKIIVSAIDFGGDTDN